MPQLMVRGYQVIMRYTSTLLDSANKRKVLKLKYAPENSQLYLRHHRSMYYKTLPTAFCMKFKY